jgi:hypothetical protein
VPDVVYTARPPPPVAVMGRITLSDAQKKQKSNRCLNAQYQAAVQHYQDEQEKPAGVKKLSLRAVAALYPGISYSTLLKYVKPGHVTMGAFLASKQKITPPEERIMVDEALVASGRGFPKSHDDLTYEANAIRRAQMGNTFTPVGNYWVQGCLERHADKLKMA